MSHCDVQAIRLFSFIDNASWMWMRTRFISASSLLHPDWSRGVYEFASVTCRWHDVHTELPLNIHMLCKLRRHVALRHHVLCFTGRLQLGHFALAHIVARITITIRLCTISWISAEECLCLSIYWCLIDRRHTQCETRTSVFSGWDGLPSYT